MSSKLKRESIVKANPFGWFIVVLMIAAMVAGVYFGFQTWISGRTGEHPDWAPQGCTIVKKVDYDNRIIVRVSNTRNFDSEQEIASVILTVLEKETDWYTPDVTMGVVRGVEVNLPNGFVGVRRKVIQFLEIRTPDRLYYLLSTDGEFGRDYWSDNVTMEDMQEVASGEKTIGFL
jgi:hypothetical protein